MKMNKVIIVIILVVAFIIAINTSYISRLVKLPWRLRNEVSVNNKQSFKGNRNNSDKSIIIMEKHMKRKGNFYFGITKDEVLEKLKSMNISDIKTINIEENKNNTRTLKVNNNIVMEFNENETLSGVYLYNGINTQMGLKTGDSIRDMEKIYGKHYSKANWNEGRVCEYLVKGYYFTVFFNNNNVMESWSVSLDSSMKNNKRWVSGTN